MNHNLTCAVCGGESSLFDVVDLNKSCLGADQQLQLSGIPVYYARCNGCGFCFAPELMAWSIEEFEQKIYNDDYVLVDPDYVDARPRNNAATLIAVFGDLAHGLKHLDYGGGGGLLSELLNAAGWQSQTYDPFVHRNTQLESLGKFDLITSYEVFEHVPDVQALMANLRLLLAENGLILFSTLISDGNIKPHERINWWYASPRNGHISLFSQVSLNVLAQKSGFRFGSFSEGFHTFFTEVPPWASHIIRVE